jgi:vacuolar-type H+-ATPase catalytic subunit A/Vma1
LAVVHNPDVTLKISTTLEGRIEEASYPPTYRARLDTDVAARLYRATLRDAVVHDPDVTLKISINWADASK